MASEKEGEPIGADLYVMFDQSGSMATPVGTGTRLSAVRAAISEFLASTNGTGFGAGIGYFGKQPIGMTSCRPADYAVPAVPIGALPGNAQPILDSLNSIMPVGETPPAPPSAGRAAMRKTTSARTPDTSSPSCWSPTASPKLQCPWPLDARPPCPTRSRPPQIVRKALPACTLMS